MIPSRIRWRQGLSGLSIIVAAMLLVGCQAGTGAGAIIIQPSSPTPTVSSTATSQPETATSKLTPVTVITTPSPEITTSDLTPVPVTATETWVTFGPDWCTRGCLTMAEWGTLIPDPLLRGAAAIAYNANPSPWRLMARIAVLRRTRILWAPLDPNTFGEYLAFANVILINSDIDGQATSAFLASDIAHEVVHAAALQPWHSAEDCYSGESGAKSWEAYTYQQTRLGSENPTLSAYLNDLLTAWQTNDLLAWVESIPGYQRECAAYS